MTTRGVDFAFSHPDPAGLYALGFRFAGRYVGPGTDDKHLTADEVAQLNGAGLAVVSLVEGGAESARGGYGVGVRHAQLAEAGVDLLGIPVDRPLYVAIDWDLQDADWQAVAEYIRGFASVVGWMRVGVYGGLKAVTYAATREHVQWLFQTYAWSHGEWFNGAQLRQTLNGQEAAGGQVDLCVSTVDDYGQWNLGGTVMSEWAVTINADQPWALTQGPPEVAGQQRDTALAWTWANATEALKGIQEILPVIRALKAGGTDADVVTAVNALAQKLDGLIATVQQLLDRPLVDAVAVADAIAARPEIAATIAKDVAQQLGTLSGTLTLSGQLDGRVGA